jgi:hypothetical protein
MSIEITTLDELDAALVDQGQAVLSQVIRERYPEIEQARGVIHDIVLYLSGGVSGGINRTLIDRYLRARSLKALAEDPNLADQDLVDDVLSNYRVTRRQGTTAVGTVAVVVTDNITVVVPAGATYTTNGVAVSVTAPIVARPAGSQILTDNERILEPRGDGTYVFTVPAVATEPGAAGNLRRGTKLTPEPLPARFVTAFASEDFTGGSDTEVNQELLVRLETGIAAKVMQGRTNIIALIREQPEFSNTLHYSIIGCGNPEMFRDQHSIVPVAGGGRIDIWARTAALPLTSTLRKEATLIARIGTRGTWQISLTRNDAPGFYEVLRISPTTTAEGGFPPQVDVRGFDMTGLTHRPDVVSAFEAAYSRFQTATIQFQDLDTDVTSLDIGAKAEYSVVVVGMPYLDNLQTFCSDPAHANLASDTLVRGAVPCWVSLHGQIFSKPDRTLPDLDAIKLAVVAGINQLDFPGRIYTSTIADIVHGYLTTGQAIGPITLLGRIRRPDGETIFLRDQHILEIPQAPSALVTPRTTAFLLDPESVTFDVVITEN